jgi:hypothetical protein
MVGATTGNLIRLPRLEERTVRERAHDFSANAPSWPLQTLAVQVAGVQQAFAPGPASLRRVESSLVLVELESIITAQARSVVVGLRNAAVRAHATDLLRKLELALPAFDTTAAPTLDARESEDGGAVLEWRFPDRRLAFTLEPDPSESGWHFVSKPSSGGVMASGELPAPELRLVLAWAFPPSRQ